MEHWPIFVALMGLVAAWSLIILGALKHMLNGNCATFKQELIDLRESYEKRLADLAKNYEKKIADYGNVERQLLELKAELPLNYVRKEDFVRHEVVINTKLDRLRDLIESLKEKKNG